MSETSGSKPPTLFWVISAGLMIWALIGVMVYIGSVSATPENMAEYVSSGEFTQEYVDYVLGQPAWATAVFALAVFSGLLGAICLLLRKAWAVPLYIASLAFIIISMIKGFLLDGAASVMTGGQIGMEVVVVLLGIFAVWFSRKKKAKGILN